LDATVLPGWRAGVRLGMSRDAHLRGGGGMGGMPAHSSLPP
jgi:hypothetical protein